MQLHRAREQFEDEGVNLVVVGQGKPGLAAKFRDEFELDGLELLVDPKRDAYARAGAKVATLGELLGPRSVSKGIATSVRTRKMQGKVQGHAAQLGGALVVAKGGEVVFAHMSENAADNAPVERLLDAAREAAAHG